MAGTTTEAHGLGDYLTILKRRWGWILLAMVAVGGAASALSLNAAPSYQATAEVVLADSAAQQAVDESSQNVSLRNRAIENEVSLTSSDEFRERLATRVEGRPQVSVVAATDSDVLRFTATAGQADLAALHANAAAATYVEIKQQRAAESITGAVDQFRTRLSELRTAREDVVSTLVSIEDRLALAEPGSSRATQLERQYRREETAIGPELTLIDAEISSISAGITKLQLEGELASTGTAFVNIEATPPGETSNTPFVLVLALGLILGLLVGVTLAFIAESLDTTIKSRNDIERRFDVPLLATIPRGSDSDDSVDPALAVANPETTEVADGYHRLRSSLQFILANEPIDSIVVTSANPAEGKTTTSSNLAWAMAALGRDVILVDVDFHRPRLHDIFGLSSEQGITSVAIEHAPLGQVTCDITSPVATIRVIPAGPIPPSPADFVVSDSFASAVDLVVEASDLTVLDAPPVLPVSDAMALSRRSSATIVTALAGSTTADELERTVSSLRQAGGRVLGIVLVGTKPEAGYTRYSGKGDASKRKGRLLTVARRRELSPGMVAIQPRAVDIRDGIAPEGSVARPDKQDDEIDDAGASSDKPSAKAKDALRSS